MQALSHHSTAFVEGSQASVQELSVVESVELVDNGDTPNVASVQS